MNQATSPVTGRPSWLRQLGRDIGYNLTSIFVGTLAFGLGISLFSAGVGTIVIYVGLFILIGALYVSSFFAAAERSMATWATGELPPTFYRGPGTGSMLRRLFTPLADPQRWKDLIHAVVSFPVRVLAFSVTISWIAAALGALTQWYWDRYLPEPNTSVWDLLGIDPLWHPWLQVGVGLLFLLTLAPVTRGLSLLQRALAIGLLTNERDQLRAEATRLGSARNSVMAAEAGTLRRIERDIHDGPQQRMVRMSMDLEAAKRRLDPSDAATAELLDSAITQSHQALAELRALSRGIAPPVLTDRGLLAALEAAAGRSPIPVNIEAGDDARGRFEAAVEHAVYFAGVESLTNAAKHSSASRCTLELAASAGALSLTVTDDGVGGAHLGKGTGLVGLKDRLAGVDGTLSVESPDGGGTAVRVCVPLAPARAAR